MPSIERLRVDLGERGYDILIGNGFLENATELLGPLNLGNRGVIISDTNVAGLYAEPLRVTFATQGIETEVIDVPAGEASKSLRQAERIFERLPQLGLDRQSFVVAVGGGVVGDLAGFIAANYLRGLPFIQVATSLMAQVDSAVGGKVGVNLPQGKNLIGAFYQPRIVLADLATLKTLPERELRAGFAEVIKYGAIRDREFFQWLEQEGQRALQLDMQALTDVVRRCCEIKAEIVAADERESGVRAILNFGHTLGHAMEALTEYVGLLHGEAISMGMGCAAKLSVKRAGLDPEAARRICRLIESAGLPTQPSQQLNLAQLKSAIRLDKKALQGKMRFILLSQLGDADISEAVTDEDIEEVLGVSR